MGRRGNFPRRPNAVSAVVAKLRELWPEVAGVSFAIKCVISSIPENRMIAKGLTAGQLNELAAATLREVLPSLDEAVATKAMECPTRVFLRRGRPSR